MNSPTTFALENEITAAVEPLLARWHVPGYAIGVLHAGETAAWGFGISHIESRQPVTPDTLFQIGSISKIFTATAIMQLVEEGRFRLDDLVTTALPTFRLADEAALATVTVRHLLTHMCGFYGDNFADFGNGDDALTKAMARFTDLRQITAPGELWSYCNTAFQAQGAIIEHHMGMPVEQAITARIFKPLSLTRSTFFAHEAITYPVAVGHNKLPDQDLQIGRPWPIPRCMNAAGGISATTGDLLRFAAFHMGDGTVGTTRLMDGTTLAAMQEPQVEGGHGAQWGLGWSLRTIGATQLVGHGGSTNGFRATLTLVPSRHFALALLSNGSGGATVNRAVEAWFLERYLGLRAAPAAAYALDSERLAAFAGRYATPTASITVTTADESLILEVTNRSALNENPPVHQPPMRARALSPTRFEIVDGGEAGVICDFIKGDGIHPRFLRYGLRLADRMPD